MISRHCFASACAVVMEPGFGGDDVFQTFNVKILTFGLLVGYSDLGLD